MHVRQAMPRQSVTRKMICLGDGNRREMRVAWVQGERWLPFSVENRCAFTEWRLGMLGIIVAMYHLAKKLTSTRRIIICKQFLLITRSVSNGR